MVSLTTLDWDDNKPPCFLPLAIYFISHANNCTAKGAYKAETLSRWRKYSKVQLLTSFSLPSGMTLVAPHVVK